MFGKVTGLFLLLFLLWFWPRTRFLEPFQQRPPGGHSSFRRRCRALAAATVAILVFAVSRLGAAAAVAAAAAAAAAAAIG